MGNSIPLTSKERIQYDIDYFKTGACSMQGYRDKMEDAVLCVNALTRFPNCWAVGVFDGHCGEEISQKLSTDIYHMLNNAEDHKAETIRKLSMELDNKYITEQRKSHNLQEQAGSTAVFAVIEKTSDGEFKITAFNIGDSRITLLHPDGSYKRLTDDHKPSNPIERNRIIAAGGFVEEDRVDRQLALSRAFGDVIYKHNLDLAQIDQKVIALPDVQTFTAKPGDILLVACDGIFEATDDNQVMGFLHNNREKSMDELACDLVDYCLISGSKDNMSCQLVQFQSDFISSRNLVERFSAGIYCDNNQGKFKRMFSHEVKSLNLNLEKVLEACPRFDNVNDLDNDLERLLATQKQQPMFDLQRLPHADANSNDLVVLPRTLQEVEFEDDIDDEEQNRSVFETFMSLTKNPKTLGKLKQLMMGYTDEYEDEDEEDMDIDDEDDEEYVEEEEQDRVVEVFEEDKDTTKGGNNTDNKN